MAKLAGLEVTFDYSPADDDCLVEMGKRSRIRCSSTIFAFRPCIFISKIKYFGPPSR